MKMLLKPQEVVAERTASQFPPGFASLKEPDPARWALALTHEFGFQLRAQVLRRRLGAQTYCSGIISVLATEALCVGRAS